MDTLTIALCYFCKEQRIIIHGPTKLKLNLTNYQHSSTAIVFQKPWNLRLIRFDCGINAPCAGVNIASSLRFPGRNILNQKPGNIGPSKQGPVKEWIHQGHITEYDTQLASSVYPASYGIVFYLIGIFTFYRGHIQWTCSSYCRWSIVIAITLCTMYSLLRLLHRPIFYFLSMKSTLNLFLLEQTMPVWRYTVQPDCLQAGMWTRCSSCRSRLKENNEVLPEHEENSKLTFLH